MTTIRQQWKIWTSKSTNYRIFGAASIVGSATAAVYIVHAAKELTVAAHFGTTDAIDAYLLAYLLFDRKSPWHEFQRETELLINIP